MDNRHYHSLTRKDAQLAQRIRNEHADWFNTIETALDQVIQGLNDFSEFKGRPKGDLESGRLFLATRTFRNLNAALNLVEQGYYQQGASLVRTAMEEMLIAEDIEVCPKTLDALLHGKPDSKTRLGRDELSYGAMALRVSPKAGEAWKKTYDAVSVYATHPRSVGLELLVTWDNKNMAYLSLRSNYDKKQLAVCIELIAGECSHLIKTVMQLLHETGSDWKNRAYPPFKELDELIEEARKTSASH